MYKVENETTFLKLQIWDIIKLSVIYELIGINNRLWIKLYCNNYYSQKIKMYSKFFKKILC